MSSNRNPDSPLDSEIGRWIDEQEPPRSAEGVADAVVARVSITNQGRQPSLLVTLATAAAAVVVAVAALGSGFLTQRGTPGDSPGPVPGQSSAAHARLPQGALVIPIGERVADPVWRLIARPGSVWVEISYLNGVDLVRIDPATNAVAARVTGVVGEAFRGEELWAMRAGVPGRCCLPAPLVQLDHETGDVLRTIDGVEGIGLSIDGDTAWTLNGRSLLRVDLLRGELVAAIDLGADTRSEPVVIVGDAVWVSTESGLKKVDIATNELVATVQVAGQTVDFIAAAEGSVWGTVFPGGHVVRIDPGTATVTMDIDVPQTTDIVWGGLTVANGTVWAAAAGGIVPIDEATGAVGDLIPLPWGLYEGVAALDGELWVTVEDDSSVVRFPMPLD